MWLSYYYVYYCVVAAVYYIIRGRRVSELMHCNNFFLKLFIETNYDDNILSVSYYMINIINNNNIINILNC